MNNIKILREELGHSQSKLIEEIAKPPYNLKISRRTLQYWESGERDIKLDKAQILADYFGVQLPYLLGWSDIRTVKAEFENEIQKQDRLYPDYGGDSDTPIEPYTALAIATVGKEFKTLLQEKILALAKGNVAQAGKYVNALNKLPSNLQMMTVRYILLTNSMQETVSELLAGLLKTNNNND